MEEEQRRGDGRLRDGGNEIRAPMANWEIHCILYITYILFLFMFLQGLRRGRRRYVIELGGDRGNEEAKELRRDSK